MEPRSADVGGLLLSEHRRFRCLLDATCERATEGTIAEPTELSELVLGLVVSLLSEEQLVHRPAQSSLSGHDAARDRHTEITSIVHTLCRAAANHGDPRRHVEELASAQAQYREYTEHAEIEVLTFLHRVFDEEQRVALAQRYPDLVRHARDSSLERLAGLPAWEDPQLLPWLRSLIQERMDGSDQPRVPERSRDQTAPATGAAHEP